LARKYTFEAGELIDLRTGAGASIEEVKRALRQGKGLGVRAMLDASPDLFYGARRDLFYSSSWLLVHYLRDATPGWSSDRFPQLMVYVAEGYPPLAAFRAVYGSPEAADAAFQRYVKSF
jgi:hypothetical protein